MPVTIRIILLAAIINMAGSLTAAFVGASHSMANVLLLALFSFIVASTLVLSHKVFDSE